MKIRKSTLIDRIDEKNIMEKIGKQKGQFWPKAVREIRKWKISTWVSLLLLAAAVVCFAVTLKGTFYYRINADDAGELILSSLLSKEHGIVSKNWYYSTELRVLNTQLVFAPLFFFIQNWHVVRVIGAMVLLLILILSAVFMCCGLGMRQGALMIAALMCMPISTEYYQFVIERSYYIPHIATMFATLGMMFRLCRERQRREMRYHCKRIGLDLKQIVFCLLSSLLALGTGLGGPRLILLFYLPLFMTAVVVWAENLIPMFANRTISVEPSHSVSKKQGWQLKEGVRKKTDLQDVGSEEYHTNEKEKIRNENYGIYVLYALLTLCSAGIGYLVNSRILSKIYHFTSYEEMSFIQFHFDRFLTTLTDFLGAFGWRTGSVSMATILPNTIAGFLFAGSLFCAFKNVFSRKWKDGPDRRSDGAADKRTDRVNRRCVSLLYLISVFILCCLFGVTDMAYLTRYNLPIAALALPVIGSMLSSLYESGLYDLYSGRADAGGENTEWKNDETARRGKGRKPAVRHNNQWELAWNVSGILVCVIIAGMLWKYSEVWNQPGSDKYIQAVDYLEQNQYGTIYASFWNGNLFTELSDGRIRSRAFTDNMDGAQNIDDYFEWLQVVDPGQPAADEKVAFVLTEDEIDHCKWRCNLREEDLVFSAENLRVYGFDNHDAMVSRFYGSYVYDFGDNVIFQTNASDTGSSRVLHPGGSSFGPYILLKQGTYRVEITGSGLDGVLSYCTSEAGSIQYKGRKNELSTEGTEQTLSYIIDNGADVSDFEIIVQNPSSSEVLIDSIRFDRVSA